MRPAVWFGVTPQPFTDGMNQTVTAGNREPSTPVMTPEESFEMSEADEIADRLIDAMYHLKVGTYYKDTTIESGPSDGKKYRFTATLLPIEETEE